MKLTKFKLNNKGFILLEYTLYLLILSLILMSLGNLLTNFINNNNAIEYSLERVEENLTDVLTIKNIILKSDEINAKSYNINNSKYNILTFIYYDNLEHFNNKLKFYHLKDRYEFNNKLGHFENTNNTKVYYYPGKEDIIYIDNINNDIHTSRVLDLSLYKTSLCDGHE